MTIQPGIYPSQEMPADLYHSEHTSYSKTNLMHFASSGLRMHYFRCHPQEKAAFDLGTAAHTAILQPERWGQDIVVQPDDIKMRRGKAWEMFRDENEGKTIITQQQADQVDGICKSIWQHSIAKPLLCQPEGQAEVSCFWPVETFKHPEMGIMFDQGFKNQQPFNNLMLKCRPDYLPGEGTVVDLKTAAEITPDAFGKHAYYLKYHWSAYLTLWGLSEMSGHDYYRYYFVVVEKAPPYDVAVYKVNDLLLDLAQKEVEQIILDLAAADKHQQWVGMPEEVFTLHFPSWAFKSDD